MGWNSVQRHVTDFTALIGCLGMGRGQNSHNSIQALILFIDTWPVHM